MYEYFPGAENLFLTVYILTFVTGLPMNILALCTFIAKFRQKVVPVDILLLNLTVSDLLLLFFLPFRMVEAATGMRWNMPYFLCPLSGFLYFSSIYLTTMFLSAVSVERYLAVAYPLKYKLFRKPVYFIVPSILIWVGATTHCSVVYIVQYNLHVNKTNNSSTERCYSKFSEKQLSVLLPVRLEMCLVLFCVPLVITTFCYSRFVHIITVQPFINKERKKRAIGLVVTTLLNFIICFLPYNISHIIGFLQGASPPWRVYALLLSTFNASVDPVVFYFSSSSFQKTFRIGLSHVMQKLHLGCCGLDTYHPNWESESKNPSVLVK